MSPGLWVVLAVLLAATSFGLWRARTDGRFRDAAADPLEWSGDSTPLTEHPGDAPDPAEHTFVPALVAGAVRPDAFGERATLLQFSSAFCAPCRATRRVLSDVAGIVPGVSHVEVDAEHHLEAVRRLDVHRTPTTLVLDAQGREVSRAVGAPRKEQVLSALAEAVG